MNKNTNDLRHSNRQITWGCFPLQCYLAGSWAVLFPAACYICRSSALFLFWLPGQLSFSLSWQADSPSRLLVPSSLCLRQSWQIISVFQLQALCPTSRVSFPLIVVFVLPSVCMFSVPSVLVSELADCKAIMLMHEAGTHTSPRSADSLSVSQLPGWRAQCYRMMG